MDDDDDSTCYSLRQHDRSKQTSTDDETESTYFSHRTPSQRPTLRTYQTINDDDDPSSQTDGDLGSASPLLRLIQKYRKVEKAQPQENRRSPRIISRLPTSKSPRGRSAAKHSLDTEARFLSTCIKDEDGQEILDINIIGLHVYELGDDLKEPESLHDVTLYDTRREPFYCFDGTLVKSNGTSQRVTAIGITKVVLDNLCDIGDGRKPNTSTALIWLQSETSAMYNAWYLVQSASPTYEIHFAPFRWLTNFTKYILDYLVWSAHQSQKIHLLDLKSDFLSKLVEWHGQDAEFQEWHAACGKAQDFRRHLTCASYAPFISGQAWNISGDNEDDEIRTHPIWDEVGLPVVSRQGNEKDCSEQTLVTSHAAKCFLQSFPAWGPQGWDLLNVTVPNANVQIWQSHRREKFGLRDITRSSVLLDVHAIVDNVVRPSPISTFMDDEDLLGKVVLVRVHSSRCYGRPCVCEDQRFAYVRSTDDYSGSEIEVSWLVTPAKTACYGSHAGRDAHKKAKAFYPFSNELFLDAEALVQLISTSDVLRLFSASVGTNSACNGDDVFISRAYCHKDRSFRTLKNTTLDQYVTEESHIGLDSTKIELFSIFTGSGFFDFGLEDGSGGLMKTMFAADINGEALKSAQANHNHAESCQYHHEDVNKLFQRFCMGEMTPCDIDCLVTGCPCKGFSKVNSNKDTLNGQRNCSLLAHTLAWVELLLPKMVVIENVPEMDSHAADHAKPTAAGQAISYLVSLGYQAKITHIRASDFGGATDRARIFIFATIPNIPLPDVPYPLRGNRNSKYAPKTTTQVTRDLNEIHNNTALNIIYPDHTPCERLGPNELEFVGLIPKDVPENAKRMPTISDAVPFMNEEQMQIFEEACDERSSDFTRVFRRVHPYRPFGTITATWRLLDSRGYPKIHWSQDRTISLLELRRFHGIPADYILIGPRCSQISQIGNSVAFAASSTIGKMLAVVWKKACSGQAEHSSPTAHPPVHVSNFKVAGVRRGASSPDDKPVLHLQKHDMVNREVEGDTIVVHVPPSTPQKHRMLDSDLDDDAEECTATPKRLRQNGEDLVMVVVPPARRSSSKLFPQSDTKKTVRRLFDVSSRETLINVPQLPLRNEQHSQNDGLCRASRVGTDNTVAGHSTARQTKSRQGSTQENAIVIDDD